MEKISECHIDELELMSVPINTLESVVLDMRSLMLRFFRYGESRDLITYVLSIGPLKRLQMHKTAIRRTNMKIDSSKPIILNLKPGEIVEVMSEEEILSTLDSSGRYHGLGFMPEMRKFCGKRFKVLKRVDKMMIEGKGMRKLRPTVILEGVFCDGEAHGGCQRTCYCFWREGWLKRV
jgi:hypothetical protein